MNSRRKEIYSRIEELRDSKLIVYVTGDKPGMEAAIANDSAERFINHLDTIGVVPKITLFLYTNGGSITSGYNIVNLIRQFCSYLEIIVPARARSAGTLMCLGADKIIMTKQATLGPIDPSINNPLAPVVGTSRIPVSVEAIKGYLDLAKHELRMKDDQALATVFQSLTEKVHPLVLGEAYRAISQIQMLAEKLLVNQVCDANDIRRIVNFLCSESGSHDYPIDRREAARVLKLGIEKPSAELYELIKEAYYEIKTEMQMDVRFDPGIILGTQKTAAYSIRRLLLESLHGGVDTYVAEGAIVRVQPNPGAPETITDRRSYDGWRHCNE